MPQSRTRQWRTVLSMRVKVIVRDSSSGSCAQRRRRIFYLGRLMVQCLHDQRHVQFMHGRYEGVEQSPVGLQFWEVFVGGSGRWPLCSSRCWS